MKNDYIVNYIIEHFPNTPTNQIAKKLNLSTHMVRSIAQRQNITKCETYKKNLKRELVINRRRWYEENIPNLIPSHIQEQIIFGSLLGDGYISKGTRRSENYYYQEHFGEKQREYREWKLKQLSNLYFTINGNYLRSISHPYFTRIHKLLYPNKIKTLTTKFLAQCTHPLFLTTLYLDDGSLTFSFQFNKKKHIVYCHPSIILYTLNFTKEENILLMKHINQTFGTNFVLSSHPDGHKTLLKLNKESEVRHLLNTIKPYVHDIPSMKYKVCLEENLKIKKENIKKRYGSDVEIIISSSERKKAYTAEEIEIIVHLKNAGVTDKEIAQQIGRSYWSVVYKIRELRKQNIL